MHQKIHEHFRINDPVLFAVIEHLGPLETGVQSVNHFHSLCREIINQQLSGSVGDVITARFESLFPKGISPEYVLALPDETIRNTGMSWSKVQFIKSLAIAVQSGVFGLEGLEGLERFEDEEVIEQLIRVKGIGRWTAEMFLMFSLGREDIFSHGDLGLRRAIQKLYGFKKEPTKKQIEKLEKRWIPYRTYACRVLWRSLEKI